MTMLVEAPPTVRPEVRLTAEDFLRLPDSHGLELVDGKLVDKVGGALVGYVGAQLCAELHEHCETSGQGLVFAVECGYRMFPARPDLVRKPSVSFVAHLRLSEVDLPEGFLSIAPDLAVEVVSPRALACEVEGKVAEYLEAGVREVWVIYPRQREIAIRRAGGAARWLGFRDTLTSEDLLPGFECPVSELFPRAPAQPEEGGSQ